MFASCCGFFKSSSRDRGLNSLSEPASATHPPCIDGTATEEVVAQQQREEAARPSADMRVNSVIEQQQQTPSMPGGLNAVRVREMQPESVDFCNPRDILDGVRLMPQELGRGTFGIVVPGSYRGVACAVKVMLSQGDLDRAALRELLLGPSLVHPNLVSTFSSRCAQLTDDFFDFLEGPRGLQDRHAGGGPRALEPVPLNSGDGFGEPGGVECNLDPMMVLHQLLFTLQARTGHAVVVTVLQMCDKGTLDNAVRKGVFRSGGPCWPERVAVRALLRTAAEVARGLLHLHDANVVHGDLKPANVLLHGSDGDARGFTAKVADFGLSHILPQAANSVFTSTWGSIAYMAPEAFDGKVSRATDVWAFGVCLWEMLTGERPFMGKKIPEVVKGVKEDKLHLKWPPPSPHSSGLIKLGRRCLSHSPDNRPNFSEILEDLVEIEKEIRAQALAGAADAGPPAAAAAAAGPSTRPVVAEAVAAAAIDDDDLLLLGLDVSGAPIHASAPPLDVAGPLTAAGGGAGGLAAAPQHGTLPLDAACGSGDYL